MEKAIFYIIYHIRAMGIDELGQFKRINRIIERDSNDATYKFALLRSVIETCQEYSHLMSENQGTVSFPTGLIVEKWLLYYYPLIESKEFIPQKNGESLHSGREISFRADFQKITDYYRDKGGFSAFYIDYMRKGLPHDITRDFLILVRNIYRTIIDMPMRFLGRSVSEEEYSIFTPDRGRSHLGSQRPIDRSSVVGGFGQFHFRREYFDIFQHLGSFISGETSLTWKWAEFSVKADRTGALKTESVLSKLREQPETERDVGDARDTYLKMLSQRKELECVWSGRRIESPSSLSVDHVIPFSVWGSNDLWNLLPIDVSINMKKSNRIPSPELIQRRSAVIKSCWDVLRGRFASRFDREVSISLTGKMLTDEGGYDAAIGQLVDKCSYLIDVRGFEKWTV